jgi:alpha-tubulin suppressor-like RCC1 family protein
MIESDELTASWDFFPSEIKDMIISFIGTKNLGIFSRCNKETAMLVLPHLEKRLKLALNTSFAFANGTIFYYSPYSVYAYGSDRSAIGLGNQDESTKEFTLAPLEKMIGEIKKIISSGDYGHSFLLTRKALYTAGTGNNGQLGLGDIYKCLHFTPVPLPVEVEQIKQLSASLSHSLLLTDDNRLFACGERRYGELGIESDDEEFLQFTQVKLPGNIKRVQQVIAKSGFSLLTTENELFQTGNTILGVFQTFTQIELPKEIKQIIDIDVTDAEQEWHCMLLTDDGLYASGNNEVGQLGFGDEEERYLFLKVPIDPNIGTIKKIVVSNQRSFLLTDKGLFVCGLNKYGALGLGNRQQCSTFTQVVFEEDIGQIKDINAEYHYTLVLTDKGLFISGKGSYAFQDLGVVDCNTFTRINNIPLFKLKRQLSNLINTLKTVLQIDSSSQHEEDSDNKKRPHKIM